MKVFNVVVVFVTITVVNLVAVGDVAKKGFPNGAVQSAVVVKVIAAVVFAIANPEEFLVVVVNDGDAWQFADDFGNHGDGVKFKPEFTFGFQCVEKFGDAFRIFHGVTSE